MLYYKKIIISCIIILLILLLSIIVYNVFYLPNISNNKNNNNSNIEVEEKSIVICKEKIDCGIGAMNYHTISTSIESSKLKAKINELNTKINNSYLKSYNSLNMFDEECGDKVNLYQRSIMTESFFTYYESSSLLTLSLVSGEFNLCTDDYNSSLDLVYYDIVEDEFLEEEDIKDRYKIDDEEVLTVIKDNIKKSNLNDSTNYSMNILDYHIYISNSGELGVYYKLADNNIYYGVPLGIKV